MIYIKVIRIIYYLIILFLKHNIRNILKGDKILKIGNKEYKYKLHRKHVFMFTKILGVLKIEPKLDEIKNLNEILVIVALIKDALLNFECAEKETLEFISAIYDIDQEEIKDLGPIHEMELWLNLFEDKDLVNFFSKVFKSKMRKGLQKKKT
jgi:hypothetical protein